jgi:hypothetical protein
MAIASKWKHNVLADFVVAEPGNMFQVKKNSPLRRRVGRLHDADAQQAVVREPPRPPGFG